MKVKGKTAVILNSIFKKDLEPVVEEEVIVDEQKLIGEIHEDFDTAGQKLIDHAKQILSEKTVIDKEAIYDKLEEIGFHNVSEIAQYRQKKEAIDRAKFVKNKIQYYKRKYPGYKFITRKQVVDICKKYGLVFGKANYYVGEIPDKNKMEIAGFELKEKNVHDKTFMIVATKSEFDVERFNLEVTGDLELRDKDPIVLAPVEHGFIVVSKWGKEENIEELKNDQ